MHTFQVRLHVGLKATLFKLAVCISQSSGDIALSPLCHVVRSERAAQSRGVPRRRWQHIMAEPAQLVGQLEPGSASPVAAVCNRQQAEAALSDGEQETAAGRRPACGRREGQRLRIVVLWPVIVLAAAHATHPCALECGAHTQPATTVLAPPAPALIA